MSLYVGCPIWTYKGWVGALFPVDTGSSQYLREYSRRLTAVEGNTTFHAVPAAATIRRWVEQTPDTFRFCPKLPRLISHAGRLEPHISAAHDFVEAMRPLAGRLGPIFLQLPPRYGPALMDDLRSFLEAWPSRVRLAVEVRDLRWFEPPHQAALDALLSRRNMAHVSIDTRPIRALQGDQILKRSVYERLVQARARKPQLPIVPAATADFGFLRYIGHPRLVQNLGVIDEWADHMAGWLGAGMDAFVFCHCPDERLDPWLCREFHHSIAARLSIPPLPWDDRILNSAPAQPPLFDHMP